MEQSDISYMAEFIPKLRPKLLKKIWACLSEGSTPDSINFIKPNLACQGFKR